MKKYRYCGMLMLWGVALIAAAQSEELSKKAEIATEQNTMNVDKTEEKSSPVLSQRSLYLTNDTMILMLPKAVNDTLTQQRIEDQKELEKTIKKQFVPDPKRALWLAAVCPGLGQIYNRKYWKLPIFYGGFLGCTYALMWNNQMYHDYSQAYLDIMDDDPNTKSYMDMLPPNYNIAGREDYFKRVFKSRKDRYRRWRDLSIFSFIGVYALSIIDAYVDAQLSQFDISPDLSLQIEPAVIQHSGDITKQSAYGVGCNLRF